MSVSVRPMRLPTSKSVLDDSKIILKLMDFSLILTFVYFVNYRPSFMAKMDWGITLKRLVWRSVVFKMNCYILCICV